MPGWQDKTQPGLIKFLSDLGEVMVDEMSELAPKGEREHEEHLVDTLYARVVQGRNAKGQWEKNVLEVGATAEYALDVEFGHLTTSGETFVPAQPYIRPVVYKFHDGVTAIASGNHSFQGNPGIA
jgi:hypothetical protein